MIEVFPHHISFLSSQESGFCLNAQSEVGLGNANKKSSARISQLLPFQWQRHAPSHYFSHAFAQSNLRVRSQCSRRIMDAGLPLRGNTSSSWTWQYKKCFCHVTYPSNSEGVPPAYHFISHLSPSLSNLQFKSRSCRTMDVGSHLDAYSAVRLFNRKVLCQGHLLHFHW